MAELWDGRNRDGSLSGVTLVRGEKIPEGQYHLVCEILVRHADGDYLLMRRDERKAAYPGWWEATAGGSALCGEDALGCARRELREETGLTLNTWRYRGIVTFVSNEAPTEYMHLFTAAGFAGQMKETCDEGTLEWVPIEKIPTLNLWEGDKIFLRLLSENAPFFSLKLVYQGSSLVKAALNGHEMPL